ncbi:acyl carrier protein [Moorena bouillonii]|uniref:Acyl carrier protein n=1 Tax=Moorena bouillonii PNG TaxID=568701 RepID=A0A1U7N073_9CYAN|nr:acyl carrier protein [Moorena bouillonii]OLT59304.1 acyl carrier protein [Moorena bouillonii PNG]
MLNSETVVKQLKEIIATEVDANLELEDIDENASLFEDGLGLDSLAIMQLITSIERHFWLRFTDDDISPDNFEDLTILSELIASKLTLHRQP